MLTPEQMEEAVGAVRAKRRELIAKPLERIYGDLLTAALPVIERAVLKKAAQACRDQAKDFLSPQYATGQPISSLGERFACGECERAILALAGEPTP